MAAKSRDGHVWTPVGGFTTGIETDAVISPQTSISTSPNTVYDVVVIGAGYAGLAAVRDLCNQKQSVLLLEARDRIGGRTYTAKKDDFLYEMGGTWVTHHMGYLFREMVRYGMDRDLITTGSPNMEKGFYTINVPGVDPRKLSHEEAGAMQAKAWDMFVNVDGQYGRTICPLPHAQLDNPIVPRSTVEQWDKVSCQDRFEEIKHKLTSEEQGLLVSLLLHISGGNLEDSSLWDMVRSHALLMHSSDNFTDVWLRYKLRDGQTELAKRMFREAKNDGLNFAFSTPVASINQSASGDGPVVIRTFNDQTFRGRKVISTIPLNVLKDIQFSPPLSQPRQEAINIGHVNHMTKVHADVSNKELERWNGMRFPGHLMYGYADGVLPNGDVHIVAFGKDDRETFIPENDANKTIDALNGLHPMHVKRLLLHNWSTDPYSQGGPAWWRPGYMSKYQDELQSRHGNILFASADWAHGWRAAIDGALEQGTLNARTAFQENNNVRPMPHKMPRTGDQTSKSAGGIKIINASLFRMGTKSMAEAYTILGYRTHHAIDDPVTVPWGLIEEAAEGKWPDVPGARARRPFTRSDWGAIWGSYDVVTDVASPFTMDLAQTYPDAIFVVVQRDFDSWWYSFKSEVLGWCFFRGAQPLVTIFSIFGLRSGNALRKCFLGFFNAKSLEEIKSNARGAYDRYFDDVRRLIPEERRLEHKLEAGWAPLCAFLGKEIPDVPFPRLNDRAAHTAHSRANFRNSLSLVVRNVLYWMVGVFFVGYLAWYLQGHLFSRD
ncbi:unnamed protein product [Clonostachys chloroleuca]|uniref:Amine oxidase n=1 Tax=Clonostachys chloroleuca TaxID=1926264 RepID=A0AA35LP35_9HYPO|nr:unnamed protein product [Clonostachys chloroleuca]